MKYDVIVLGGGPGGYLAAERAGQAGLSALLIESRHIGGTCLNEGCIPTKTLLRSAKLYKACLTAAPYGVRCEGAAIDQSAVVDRKRRVTASLVSGVKAGLKSARVKTVEGVGTIEGRGAEGISVSAAGETHTCKKLIIASGSRAIIPKIEGLDAAMKSGFALTSTELLEQREHIDRLCVVGGGVIGLEMATYYAMTGTKLSVVEAAPKIAGALDTELTAAVQRGCEALGMEFYLNSRAVRFESGAVVMEGAQGEKKIDCDRALLCIGRRANTEGFGLEKLNVPCTARGISVDEHCFTGVPDVYAIGDCTGQSMQAHVAYREAEVAVNHILGVADEMRWGAVPGLVHTEPEAAFAGLTAEEAKSAGIDAVCSKLSMNYSGLYLAENENGAGIIKLVFDRKRRTLIGAHIAGGPAAELITICSLLIENELPIERMKRYVFPHPTCGEAIREALFAAKL